MKRLPLTAPSLRAWRKRDSITSGQAAYLLAGLEPVKNPNPSLPPNAKAVYSHLLNAIYSGELSAHKITRRIEPDTAWVDSLSPEEYMKWGCEWEEISCADLKQDNSKYRFSIDAQLFFTWAEAGGWFDGQSVALPSWLENTNHTASQPSLSDAGWWYVVPLKWCLYSGVIVRSDTPTRILKDIKRAMEQHDVERGQRVSPNAEAQRLAASAALANADVDLGKKLPSKKETRQIAAQLLALAAKFNGCTAVNDEDALFKALEAAGIQSPSIDQLSDLTTEM